MSHDSTRKRRSRKAADRPKKPYPDFPLSPHASGAWQKKIRGKIHYFGKWAKRVNGKLVRIEGDGWQEALELYKTVADDLHAGRTPRVTNDGLTVADLCNRFLTAKMRKRDAGELGSRMFEEYREITDLTIAAFGKTRLVDDLAAADFESLRATMTERWGPVRICNAITRVKSVFRYATENRLIPRPPEFGSEFKKPDKSVLRRHKATQGVRMLEADEIRTMLDGAVVVGEDGPELVKPTATIKAMTFLGINCGFGNADCASLPMSCLDLDGGWVSYPRPKSGIARRAKLWPQTVAAIRASLAERTAPTNPADADIVFLQPSGRRWVRLTEKSLTDNLTVRFGEMLKKLGFHRPGIGFYSLRHSFRTAADASCDAVAIDLVMGHTDGSMASHYRERIDDSRLQAVAACVRSWLFGETPNDGPTGAAQGVRDPFDLSDVEETDSGSEGSLKMETAMPVDARPALRLYVG